MIVKFPDHLIATWPNGIELWFDQIGHRLFFQSNNDGRNAESVQKFSLKLDKSACVTLIKRLGEVLDEDTRADLASYLTDLQEAP